MQRLPRPLRLASPVARSGQRECGQRASWGLKPPVVTSAKVPTTNRIQTPICGGPRRRRPFRLGCVHLILPALCSPHSGNIPPRDMSLPSPLATLYVARMALTSDIAQLEATKAKAAKLAQTIAAALAKELAALPAAYGFNSVDEFVKAVRGASGGKAPRRAAAKPKAIRRRRAVITAATRAKVKVLVRAGKPGSAIAKALGISLPSVQNIKKALGLVKARKAKAAKPSPKKAAKKAPKRRTPRKAAAAKAAKPAKAAQKKAAAPKPVAPKPVEPPKPAAAEAPKPL